MARPLSAALHGAGRRTCWPGLAEKPLTVAYLFTTFPKASEAFLQRDVAAMLARGIDVRLFSLWGGGGRFRGLPVVALPRWWFFVALLWWIPYESARYPAMLGELIRNTLRRRAPSTLNFWENMLGAGFVACFIHRFRRERPDLIHAVWAGAPATAAWLLWRLTGVPYVTGAHAYDLYEHGGDWWLKEKVSLARLVHASTDMARRTLLERGAVADRVVVIRRGLEEFPPVKPLRSPRRPLRLLCVARLVPKKGLRHQMGSYAAVRAAGLEFEARIVGDGDLRDELKKDIAARGLAPQVTLTGQLPPEEVGRHLAWADVLLHTGVVAATGDRDGLPNAIPEAMAAGVLVVTSATAATTEAVQHEETGLVADVDRPETWLAALRRLETDDVLAERLRAAARRWTEENYDAHRNADRLRACFEAAVKGAGTPPTAEPAASGR